MKTQLSISDTQAEISAFGAELQSLIVGGKERIWTAEEQWWPRHSPVLFPRVGKSKGNQIEVDGKAYPMNQHGFARDMAFEKVESADSHAQTYRLYDSGETLARFPFPFELELTYSLLKDGIHVRYQVINPGNRPLPFSLGAHPGFLLPAGGFKELNMQFSEDENLERHLLEDGLFNGQTESLGSGKILPLSVDLFNKDAIVLKALNSRKVELIGPDIHLEMQFGGFEDFGIWTKKSCETFLCLEPWYGYADSTDESEREGLHLLEPGKTFEAFWQVRFMDSALA